MDRTPIEKIEGQESKHYTFVDAGVVMLVLSLIALAVIWDASGRPIWLLIMSVAFLGGFLALVIKNNFSGRVEIEFYQDSVVMRKRNKDGVIEEREYNKSLIENLTFSYWDYRRKSRLWQVTEPDNQEIDTYVSMKIEKADVILPVKFGTDLLAKLGRAGYPFAEEAETKRQKSYAMFSPTQSTFVMPVKKMLVFWIIIITIVVFLSSLVVIYLGNRS